EGLRTVLSTEQAPSSSAPSSIQSGSRRLFAGCLTGFLARLMTTFLAVLLDAALLGHLLGSQILLVFHIRVIVHPVLDAHGRAFQLEDLAEGLLQITGVAGRHLVGLLAVDDDDGRVVTAGMGVAHLDPPTIDHR